MEDSLQASFHPVTCAFPRFSETTLLQQAFELENPHVFEGLHLNRTPCYTMCVPLPFIFQTIQLPGSLSQTSCLWSLGMSGQGDGSYRSIGIEESRRGRGETNIFSSTGRCLWGWWLFFGLATSATHFLVRNFLFVAEKQVFETSGYKDFNVLYIV